MCSYTLPDLLLGMPSFTTMLSMQNKILRIILVMSIIVMAYAFASNNDYHEIVDKVTPIKYTT
jgi:hypothetical protein